MTKRWQGPVMALEVREAMHSLGRRVRAAGWKIENLPRSTMSDQIGVVISTPKGHSVTFLDEEFEADHAGMTLRVEDTFRRMGYLLPPG